MRAMAEHGTEKVAIVTGGGREIGAAIAPEPAARAALGHYSRPDANASDREVR